MVQKSQDNENDEEADRDQRFIKDGTYIAGGRTARVWNVKTFKHKAVLQGHDGTNDCLCASGGTAVECPINGHFGDILSVSWSPQGDKIATGR